jgi:hypothetical protein
MNTTHSTKTKRLIAAVGAVAAAAVAPALLFAGAGTAHAGPDTCDGMWLGDVGGCMAFPVTEEPEVPYQITAPDYPSSMSPTDPWFGRWLSEQTVDPSLPLPNEPLPGFGPLPELQFGPQPQVEGPF